MNIPITATHELLRALESHSIKFEDYAPAYSGESAGIDLYNAGEAVMYPAVTGYNTITGKMMRTGLRIAIPSGYVGIIKERGSIIKTPLITRAGVIDSGYTGEIFVNAVNTGKTPFHLPKFAKSPYQLIVVPCLNQFQPVSESEYQALVATARGQGKIGSSD